MRMRVLLVAASQDDVTSVLGALRSGGYDPTFACVRDGVALARELATANWDVCISDWEMPGFGATQALAIVSAAETTLPFIVVSGVIGEEATADILRAGARDFVLRTNLARLVPAIERELRTTREHPDAAPPHPAKTEAVGRVAHDFNNALSIILSFSKMIRDRLDPGDTLWSDIEEIRNAALHAAELTRRLAATQADTAIDGD
jgi:DNA-binding NtrC family response regulator